MSRIRSTLPDGESQFRRPAQPKKKQRWMKRSGKKTKAWDAIRRVLKKRFAAAGVTTCEIGEDFCVRDNYLGFAHAKKRRNCSAKDLWTVILACASCHSVIELLPEAEMKKAVLAIIAKRTRQP